MAYQSQTYSNSNNGYYIQGGNPIVPGDQAIIGPLEILPSDTSTQPTYYNRFNQTNATGLSISEFRTAGNELLSDIILNTQNSILLTSRRTGEEAVLEVGVNQAGDAGRVTINANDGLVVKNLAGSGKGLQIYHDGPTNQNRLEVADTTPAGARMNFNVNSSDITFTNDVTSDFMKISPQTNIFQVETPGAGLTAVTPGGVGFIGVGTNGRVGPFGGASVTLDSSQGVTIRTNAGVAPLPNYNTITANQNGTVNFLSTITAPTANISTINNSTMTVTGNARIASVAVTNENTSSSVPYSTYYGNYQGNLRYNTIRDTAGAPATAIESLEIVNVAGGPQTGGIQFYTSNNFTPNILKYMGGFLDNNVAPGQSEFFLASTTTASMRQIRNISTLNNIPITDYGNPTGTIIQFAAWAPPNGYLRCDGTSYATATYPNLFGVIGYIYGGSGANFNVPDCVGKTMMGALSQYTGDGNLATLTNYVSLATYQGIVTGVSVPGGGAINTGIWFSGSTKPISPGMILAFYGQAINFTPDTGNKVKYIVGGDGRGVGENLGFLVIFEGNVSAGTIAPGDPLQFIPALFSSQTGEYPMLGLQNTTGTGIGNFQLFQETSQVGSHAHTGTPDTNIAAAPGGFGPQGGRGGTSDKPNSVFTFTRPAYGAVPALGLTVPQTMNILPYNLGVTMCIKT
jgi:microcystin-dependent protein